MKIINSTNTAASLFTASKWVNSNVNLPNNKGKALGVDIFFKGGNPLSYYRMYNTPKRIKLVADLRIKGKTIKEISDALDATVKNHGKVNSGLVSFLTIRAIETKLLEKVRDNI